MDDDYLYRLRKKPPPEFARRLEAHLARQELEQRFRSRPRLMRNVLAALFVGGAAALAASFVSMHGLFTLSEDSARILSQERVARARNYASPSRIAGERPQPGSAASSNGVAGERRAVSSKPAPVTPPVQGTANSADAETPGITTAAGRNEAWPRDRVVILTAPSAYGYTRDVAKRFSRSGFPEPHVETRIPSDGWSFFCADRSPAGVHVVVRFGRLTAQERRVCDELPTENLIEVKLGYESIVLARSNVYGAFPLSPREVFLALAAEVPDPSNPERFIGNPHRAWSDVDPALPYDPIEVIGPHADSPLGRGFAALMLEAGCSAFPQIAALRDTDESRYARLCGTVRGDGVYAEVAEGFDVMLRMETYPTVIGVLTHHFFETNRDSLNAAPISGVEPTPAALASGDYPASRPLYLYVKPTRFRSTPGLFEFVYRYHEAAPLFGLVALQETERRQARAELLESRPPSP